VQTLNTERPGQWGSEVLVLSPTESSREQSEDPAEFYQSKQGSDDLVQ
jgi:hypothetical protein